MGLVTRRSKASVLPLTWSLPIIVEEIQCVSMWCTFSDLLPKRSFVLLLLFGCFFPQKSPYAFGKGKWWTPHKLHVTHVQSTSKYAGSACHSSTRCGCFSSACIEVLWLQRNYRWLWIGQCCEDFVLNFFNPFEGVRAAGPMGKRAGNGAGLYQIWVVVGCGMEFRSWAGA